MKDVILSPIPKDELFRFIESAVSNAVNKKEEIELSDELISRSELKEYTGIQSDVTVIRFERLGIFKPIRLGRRLYYKKAEVKRAIDNLQRK